MQTSPLALKLPEVRRTLRNISQVTQPLDNPTTREREARALRDAMQALKVQESMILAEANAESIQESRFTIQIRSPAEWLLIG